MEGYTSEKEQLDSIRQWWKKNGASVLMGVAVAVAVLAGGTWWMNYQRSQSEVASEAYARMLEELKQGQTDVALSRGKTLIEQHDDSVYAVLAAFVAAEAEVKKDDLAAARGHLQWALEHGKQPALSHIARLRLARVLLAENNSDGALAQLNGVDPGEFLSSYEELRGDVLVAKGDAAGARAAYSKAMNAPGKGGVQHNRLQIKLDDLAANS